MKFNKFKVPRHSMLGLVLASTVALMSSGSLLAMAVNPVNDSNESLNFLDATLTPYANDAAPHAWNESVYGTALAGVDLYFQCPTDSIKSYPFISPRGSERRPVEWIARGQNGLIQATKQVSLPDLRLQGLNVGSVNNVKGSGGDYSLGIACTDSFGTTVTAVSYRFITVTAGTGAWVALPAPNIAPSGSIPPSTSPSSSPSTSPSSSPSTSPSSSPSTSPSSSPSATPPAPLLPVSSPSWADSATMYQVNMRIFTSAGNIAAFANQLPRLKQLGVKILCFMPVTPISTTNHKGTQGSVFAVDDYRAINPTYGTATDFKNLITTAHNNGFKVMVDWNAASTGFDHAWTISHPTWYKQDYNQNILAVSARDSDLAALDYTKADLRTAMIAEMNYWVTYYDVDGFRAVSAATVPIDFWNRAMAELRQVKPMLFAADVSSASANQYAFVTGYNPAILNIANAAGKMKASKSALVDALLSTQNNYASPAFGLNYITNNDVNATTGSEVKRVGAAAKAMAALTFTAPGMPLIYSGQEIGLDKQLKIYDYDRITWPTTNATQTFYKKLVSLKAKNLALSSGLYAGSLTVLTTNSKTVGAFSRRSGTNVVITLVNLGSKKTKVSVKMGTDSGSYFDLITGKKVKLAKTASVTLAANGFAVYSTVAAN